MPRRGKVIVQHRVKDVEFWKPFFTEDGARQKRAGFTRWHLMRNIHDANDLIIVFDCKDLDKAEKVYSDPKVSEIIKKAGVVGATKFILAEEVESREL